MIDPRRKRYLRRFEWIIGWKVNRQKEHTTLVRRLRWSHYGSLPVKKVIAHGTRAALRWWITTQVLQLFLNPFKRHFSTALFKTEPQPGREMIKHLADICWRQLRHGWFIRSFACSGVNCSSNARISQETDNITIYYSLICAWIRSSLCRNFDHTESHYHLELKWCSPERNLVPQVGGFFGALVQNTSLEVGTYNIIILKCHKARKFCFYLSRLSTRTKWFSHYHCLLRAYAPSTIVITHFPLLATYTALTHPLIPSYFIFSLPLTP